VVGARPALERRGIDHGEIELRVGRAEPVEGIEGLIDHPPGAAAGPVDLVDHHDGLQPLGERLAGDEAGLRHRPLDRVDQQQHAVHHGQHALDLAAEVGVAGRVDDVDARAAVLDGAVLREDRDAALALDVVGVHDALAEPLVRGEGPRLLEETIYRRGLAVVDVRDDGDIADRAIHGGRLRLAWRASAARAAASGGIQRVRSVADSPAGRPPAVCCRRAAHRAVVRLAQCRRPMRSAAVASRTSMKNVTKAALRHSIAPTNSTAITTPSSEPTKALANSVTTTSATRSAAIAHSEIAK